MRLLRYRRGMSVTELLLSVTLTMVIIGIGISIWLFAYRTWAIERMRSKLRINLEMAIENIKAELRLSNAQYISLYKPPSESQYQAITFPMPTIGSSGFATLEGDGTIYWDRSVIYHVFGTSPNLQLRRTEFTSNNAYLTNTAQREAQLLSVYTNGDGSAAPNSSNATTKTIFTNLVDLIITPATAEFDGYNATTIRSDSIAMGSIKLAPGNHLFRFIMTGKNPSNSDATGYKLGLDSITITPSGCARETEVYSLNASTGEASSIIYALGWGGDNYFEYNANAVNDYAEFQIYYDQFRESNFDETIRSNVIKTLGTNGYPDNPLARLASPDDYTLLLWQAADQTSSGVQDYPPAGGDPLPASDNFILRTAVKGKAPDDFIDKDTNERKIRIKFVSHSLDSLTIAEAWLCQKNHASAEPWDGSVNLGQITFNNGTATSITIPAASEQWSDWVTAVLADDSDYFVSMRVTVTANNKKFRYWDPSPVVQQNTFFADASVFTFTASTPDWTDDLDGVPGSGDEITISPFIFSIESIEQWPNQGTVISNIFDTKINSASEPNYSTISWDDNTSALGGLGAVAMEVRAGDVGDLSDAGAYQSVSNGGSIPAGLDGKRYIQFKATLSNAAPYSDYPWIDNVTINWPGEEKVVDINCYFTKKPNYGILTLKIDGQDLTKGLGFKVSVYDSFQGNTYTESLTAQVEPRNSGL